MAFDKQCAKGTSESEVADTAESLAHQLARELGISIGRAVQTTGRDAITQMDTVLLHYLCGDLGAWPSFETSTFQSDALPHLTSSFSQIVVSSAYSFHGKATIFDKGSSIVRAGLSESNAAYPWDYPAFSIVASQPSHFVQARASFAALVRPDVLLIAVALDMPGVPSASVVQKIFISQGVSNSNLVQVGDVFYAKVTPNARRLSDLVTSLRNARASAEVAPFISDCETVRSSVARAAVKEANSRAALIASLEHTRLERLIGIADSGDYEDAFCGAGAAAPVAGLVAKVAPTLRDLGVLVFDHPSDRIEAEFARMLTVTWATGSQDVSTSSYARAPERVAPIAYRPSLSECEASSLVALGKATNVLLATSHPRGIIDLGPRWDDWGQCGFRGVYNPNFTLEVGAQVVGMP